MRLRSLFCMLQLLATLFVCLKSSWPQVVPSQQPTVMSASSESVIDLQRQVRELQSIVKTLQDEVAENRARTIMLKNEIAAARKQLPVGHLTESPINQRPKLPFRLTREDNDQSSEQRLGKLEEEQLLLAEKVNEQYQTKLESASKYRMRFSGIALFNLFSNRGSVDNLDVPSLALTRSAFDSHGSFGGTLRQSELGLEVFAPQLAGANASGNLQFDFSGGFPNSPNGITQGLVRLRTGTLRLDWKRTSLIAGQDALFFSPLTPTSFASLSIPALAYAGNLWTWTPQLRIEHQIALSGQSSLLLQTGILDPLTGEPPPHQSVRQPQAGERSRQPGYGGRIAWTNKFFNRPITAGIGGYYARQNWGFQRNVNAWAGMADWSLPLSRWFSITGEFYRGRSVGGLGGSLGRSVLFNGSLSLRATPVHGLDSLGGWTQLKFKPVGAKVEFNAAVGQDNPLAREVRSFSGSQAYFDPTLVRNRSWFANTIYRPRSDLIFSVEYRHFQTFTVGGDHDIANQINTLIGITF